MPFRVLEQRFEVPPLVVAVSLHDRPRLRKDLRTWAGTVMAARRLRAFEPCFARRTRAHGNVVDCIRHVAAELGNTPAVCKRCYVHPALLEAYLDGTLGRLRGRSDEALVRAVIAHAERTPEPRRLTPPLEASVRAIRRRAARERDRGG